MAGQASSMLGQGLLLDSKPSDSHDQGAMTRNPLSQLETVTLSELAVAELKHGTSNGCHEPAGPPPPLIIAKKPQLRPGPRGLGSHPRRVGAASPPVRLRKRPPRLGTHARSSRTTRT